MIPIDGLERAAWARCVGLGIVCLALLHARPDPEAAAQSSALEPYVMIDQWPDKAAAAARGIIQEPTSLDVDADGRVYVADVGLGGVHVMLPTGDFLGPFGTDGPEEARLGTPHRLSVEQSDERVYVLDRGGSKVIVYDLDFNYIDAWEGISGAGIAAARDGRVYVADREHNRIQAYGRDGSVLFTFGRHGTGAGEFTLFTDIGVSPDGLVLAVGDMNGLRVQLFDLLPTGAEFRRDYLLNHPRYTTSRHASGQWSCRASVVNALGGDEAWIGEGGGACHLRPDGHDFVIATSAAQGTICKQTVRFPRIRPATGQYYAIATYDPNVGPCESPRRTKDTREDTILAVVQYVDDRLSRVRAIHKGPIDDEDDRGLISPLKITVPVSGTVFVQDSSVRSRLFTPDGTPLAAAALRSRWSVGVTNRVSVEIAEGTDVHGEIFGYYREEHRGRDPSTKEQGWVEHAHGIGRFKTVKVREYDEEIDVLEPIWQLPFADMSPERARPRRGPTDNLEVIDLAYNAHSDKLEVLVYERKPTIRKEDARIELVWGDGTRVRERWDLPDDQTTSFIVNPYSDLSVAPDGRTYALNDYEDEVVAFEVDGNKAGSIHVAPDVRRIAGGWNGRLFALREPGYVERYESDGAVTARFDGRPSAAADPQTLTDLAADRQGRVYVADGRSSVVSVFEPGAGSDPGAREIPPDASCRLSGDKTAEPARLILGDMTQVALEVDGLCGVGEEPSDIMLVVLYYPRFGKVRVNGADDPAAPLVRELRRFVSRVDFAKHRLGIVSYWADTQVELALTHDRSAALKAIQNITRKWPFCRQHGFDGRVICNLMPRIKSGMHTAQAQFDPGSGARRVMVLYQPDYCNRVFEYYDGACRGYVPAEDEASAIRAAGTRVVVFDGNRSSYREYRFDGTRYNGDAQPLGTSDEDVVFDYAAAHHRMVSYRVPDHLATNFRLTDEIPSNMWLVPGSVTAGGNVSGNGVQWNLAELGYGTTRFALTLKPLQAGTWPTNVQAVADYTDGWGHPGQIVFPVPEVVVAAPTPTPAEPTPTFAAPTEVPGPRAIYLPHVAAAWAVMD